MAQALPNHWLLGQVSGVDVDSHDHIWVIHRPRTTDEHDNYLRDKTADCCAPAPPVLEFDQAGNLLQSWGGPGQGYDWPDIEHGIYVDHKDNVWLAGNGDKDTNILKFSNSGKFLLQIGKHGKTGGSNDTENVNKAAGIAVYAPTNEVFVADGYGNRRVIVFDADTGAYKRHWGAYGNKPDDAAPFTRVYEGAGPPQFNTVHGIAISNDGIVYVGDRVNNRIQSFSLDGTFLKEVFIERKTSARDSAPDSAWRFPATSSSASSTCPTGPTRKCRSWTASRWKWWVSSAATAATGLASSPTFTASPPIPRATSTWARSTRAGARTAGTTRG